MKSKLLQPINHSLNRSRDDQQESIEDSSVPWRERENLPGRVSPASGAQARKDIQVSWSILAEPTPAAMKVHVFDFIDWSLAASLQPGARVD